MPHIQNNKSFAISFSVRNCETWDSAPASVTFQSVPDPRVGLVERADFVRLVGELIETLGWPDAQQGSCRAPVYVTRPLPAIFCGPEMSDVIGQDRLCSQFLATPRKLGTRILPSVVHSWNATSQTNLGSTHLTSALAFGFGLALVIARRASLRDLGARRLDFLALLGLEFSAGSRRLYG